MKSNIINLCLSLFLFIGLVLGCGNKDQTRVNLNGGTSNNANYANTFTQTSPTATPTPAGEYIFEHTEKVTKLPSSVQITSKPYIKGKIVTFYYNEDVKEWIQDTAPHELSEIEAKFVEDVGTIVLKKTRKVKYATYTTDDVNRIPAYVQNIDVTIIDRTIPAVIFRRTFKGDRPAETVSLYGGSHDEILGDSPDFDIDEFLSKLPRR